MTTRDEIETRLLRAVAVEPSEDGLRWLDQQVSEIAARPVTIPRRGLFTSRLILRPLLLLAAFLLLAGAVAGGIGLLDQLFQSSGPGWRTGWDRAERLDLKQTDGGVTITLERAYADLNQVLVGFTVEGLEAAPLSGHGEPAPLEWMAELRDPTGRPSEQWTTGHTALGVDVTKVSAVGQTWVGAVTPMPGTWELTFTSIGYNGGGLVSGECYGGNTDPACDTTPANAMIDGTWRFEYELPAPGGTVVTPDVSDTQGQATLTLTELRITPTMISARIGLFVGGNAVAWAFIPRDDDLRHDGTLYSFRSGARAMVGGAGVGEEMEFYTIAGSEEAAGTWEIVIPELTYEAGNGQQVELAGPWTLKVTVQ